MNRGVGAGPAPHPEQADPAAHARYVQRVRRRYADWLPLLPPGPPCHPTIAAAFDALAPHAADLPTRLRVLRQLVVERLATRDCSGLAPLADTVAGITALAEFALEHALADALRQLDARHGEPRTPDGARACLWVVGMGKLGARELNVSSDIDLVFVYDCDGDTAGADGGRGRISNHEYFAHAARRVSQCIGDVTEHGNVFRVDLLLRPNGGSGPAAVSLAALEEYFQVQGREWERFAWLKSRVVAPRAAVRGHDMHGAAVQGDGVQALRNVVLPFVFRKYLDYSVFDALRNLHRQIREQAARRAAGKPERANDVKLSRGGIREVEFTVQLLQVVRGGQFPELRCRPTLDALARVARAGLMPDATAAALGEAYTFLRHVEHRIQYLDDQQTHLLPTGDDDLRWLALGMGFESTCPFLHALDAHRELVAQEFDTLLGGARRCSGGQCGGPKPGAPGDIEALLDSLPPRLRERIAGWREHPRIAALRDATRDRLLLLLQRTGAWVAEGRVSEEGALQMAQWIEQLLRRESYLALLAERPAVHERLLRLLGAARWPAHYLHKHPGLIDELASAQLFDERFDAAAYTDELERRRSAVAATGEDDDETLLDMLRRAHHAEVFRTLARDVEGCLTVEQVADDLSALADATLAVTVRWCWARLRQRHRSAEEGPRFAILAYGKLGGKELGYGGDLDIVFVYEDDEEGAPDAYAAFVRKLIGWLTVKTGEGDLFEIDTALRPNGSSGLLITTFAAYENYQLRRGSNTAWTWEHQAMTRARFCVGAAALAPRFAAVREAVVTAARDAAALAREVVAMREKVRAAHPVPAGRFDPKHSPGGMVDAEFAVQHLVLAHAAAHPALRENAGNIALLQRAESASLLPPGVGRAAADAYRTLRRAQHGARLAQKPVHVPLDALLVEREAIRALWVAVFGAGASVTSF